MVTIFLAGLAAWIGTSVITEAEIFRDVREACDKVHDKYNNWWTYKLRYLIYCPMCTGIWVSAIIAFFIPPFIASGFIGWGLTALTIKGFGHGFFVLQKLAESVIDHNKSKTESNQFDLEDRKEWKAKTESQNAKDAD